VALLAVTGYTRTTYLRNQGALWWHCRMNGRCGVVMARRRVLQCPVPSEPPRSRAQWGSKKASIGSSCMSSAAARMCRKQRMDKAFQRLCSRMIPCGKRTAGNDSCTGRSGWVCSGESRASTNPLRNSANRLQKSRMRCRPLRAARNCIREPRPQQAERGLVSRTVPTEAGDIKPPSC
jgi:hypothetical protein